MTDIVLKNWKSSLLGILGGVLYIIAQTYKPGMTWRDFAVAAAIAGIGLVTKDSTTHSTVAQVQDSTNEVAKDTGTPAVVVVTKPSEGVYTPHD
jgi:hypothetical protein